MRDVGPELERGFARLAAAGEGALVAPAEEGNRRRAHAGRGIEVDGAGAVLGRAARAGGREIERCRPDETADGRDEGDAVGRITAVAIDAVTTVGEDAEAPVAAHAARGDDADRGERLAINPLDAQRRRGELR